MMLEREWIPVTCNDFFKDINFLNLKVFLIIFTYLLKANLASTNVCRTIGVGKLI